MARSRRAQVGSHRMLHIYVARLLLIILDTEQKRAQPSNQPVCARRDRPKHESWISNPRTTAERAENSFRSATISELQRSTARRVTLLVRSRVVKDGRRRSQINLSRPCFVSIGCYVRPAVFNEEHSDCAYFTQFLEKLLWQIPIRAKTSWFTIRSGTTTHGVPLSMDTKRVRASAGITKGKVFRSAEDPNDVVLLMDVADVAKVRTWMASDDLKTAMEKGGVIGTPTIRYAA